MDIGQFQQIIAQHGGISGTTVQDPLVDAGVPGAPKESNVTPVYIYTFNDGTKLAARSERDDTFSVTDWGTAGPDTKRTTTSGLDQVIDPRTNEVIGLRDPKSGQVITLPKQAKTGTPGTIVYIPGTQIPVGIYDETGAYRDLTATEQKALGVSGVGGSGGSGSTRVRFPDEVAQSEAQTRLLNAQAAAAEQKLKPEMGLLLENHLKTIDQVQQMLASGQIKSVAEADAIMGLAKQNLDAAMQGTTPFQMAQEKAKQETERAQIGQSLINQRLSTGGSLANTLISAFANSKLAVPEGGSFSFDPFALARGFTSDVGGGQETGDIAKSLIGTLQPTAAMASAPMASAAPSGSGLPLNVLMGLQLAEQADMKRQQEEAQQSQEVPANG